MEKVELENEVWQRTARSYAEGLAEVIGNALPPPMRARQAMTT